eukprot:scaffold2830_cov32-Cyclotella_meneghiniana.AAC.3
MSRLRLQNTDSPWDAGSTRAMLVLQLPLRLLVDCCFGFCAGLVRLLFWLWLWVSSHCQLQAAPDVPPLQVDCCFGVYDKIVPSASRDNTKCLGNLSSALLPGGGGLGSALRGQDHPFC